MEIREVYERLQRERGNDDIANLVYMSIKTLILNRLLTANERINIDYIAESLGTSRTPVRDAVNRLTVEGFIRVEARKGTFVNGIRKDDLINIYECRQVMELFALERGFNMLKSQTGQLMGLVNEWRDAYENGYDTTIMLNADAKFHKAIVDASTNSRLVKFYDELNSHVRIAGGFMLQGDVRLKNTYMEHAAIVREIDLGSLQSAKDALKYHLDESLTNLLRVIERVKVF